MTSYKLNKMQDAYLDLHYEVGDCAGFIPPGGGKTMAWLDLAHKTGDDVLVVAPRLVCSDTWPRENRKWGFNIPMRFLHGREKHTRGREQISLINYDALPWLMEKLAEDRKPRYSTVVFDEVSKMKNPESKRVKEFLKYQDRFKFITSGTGTPVGAHLLDLFGEMLVTDRGESFGRDYEMFKRRFFYEDKYTRIIEPYPDSEPKLLNMLRDRAISFDINDLDMPPLSHIPRYLDMPADVRKVYEQMREESAVEHLDLYAVNAAVKSGKLRQIASGGVLDLDKRRKYLHDSKAEHLQDIMDEHRGRPILVFFEFVSDYVTICKVMGREVPALYGGTKGKDATRWIRDWNAGKLPILACHPRSASYGLNLQDSGNVVVFYTIPWSYEMINQGIARLWRQGQKNKVLAYYLIVEDSEDERVYERVEERADTHDRVMKGLQRT